MNQLLKENYLDASLPGSLSGFQNFQRALKNRGINVRAKQLKEWMSSEPTYSLHKPTRRSYKRNKVLTLGIDYLWQIDLVDMKKYSRLNKGIKYLFTCIDVFSKYAWVVPMKSKDGKSSLLAFKKILESGRKPEKIQSDAGKEFLNKSFKELLNKQDISLYTVASELKASVVERFNRTFKEKMWRNFTARGKYIYHDVIDKIVNVYNNSYHRTIKMRPVDVDEKNEPEIYERVFSNKDQHSTKFKFNINDKVRISKYKSIFSKGYTSNWSEEIFIIDDLVARNPNAYRIKDLNNEHIEGVFYETELQKILKEDDVYKIEKILKSRIRNRKKEVYVKWFGYSDNFNSWIPASDIVK